MNCPVCNRNHPVTLSICPSCGAMINDSVREELEVKKSPVLKPSSAEKKEFLSVPYKTDLPISKPKINLPPLASAPSAPKLIIEKTVEKSVTTEINVKPTASTLIEFQNKNATLPDWRLQLQNAVKKRQGATDAMQTNSAVAATNGANALKIQPQFEPEIAPAPEITSHANPTLNKALQRIADSRQQFLIGEESEIAPIAVAETAAPTKNYPFRIAAKAGEILPAPTVEAKPATVNYTVKPRTVIAPKPEKKEFDTNKLPPLPVEVKAAFDIHKTVSDKETKEVEKTELKLVETEEISEEAEIEFEEIEDIAPFSMRFNAGLFDFIIGAFTSLILLAPFMLKGGNWLSLTGFLAFSATCAIVLFIYMTVSVGFYGRTFGMRLFALEVVDIEGENYPTIHQAAVSSSVYLLSMAFGGAGFLTLPFNEEKRAVHDIVSGTIVVKEI